MSSRQHRLIQKESNSRFIARWWKLAGFKSMGIRVSQVIMHIDATSSLRTDKVGGNRIGLLLVASHTCVSVRKRRWDLVEKQCSTDWKLDLKLQMLQKLMRKKWVCGGIKPFRVDTGKAVWRRGIYGPLQEEDTEVSIGVIIILKFKWRLCVCVCVCA